MNLRPTSTGLLCGLLAASLAACGGDDSATGEPGPPSTPRVTSSAEPSPTSEPATESEGDRAAAAVLQYLKVRDEAYATGRIRQQLNQVATGPEHLNLRVYVASLNEEPKTHFEGEWRHEVVDVTRRSSEMIMVTDCEDGTDVKIVREEDGEELPWITYEGEELPRRLEQTYRVILEKKAWKVHTNASTPTEVQPC